MYIGSQQTKHLPYMCPLQVVFMSNIVQARLLVTAHPIESYFGGFLQEVNNGVSVYVM